MSKIIEKLLNLMAVLAGILLFFVTFSVGYTILTRVAGISSPVWVIQFNEYALLWITFLGAAWVLARNKHVSVDLLTSRLEKRARMYLKLAHSLAGTAVCGVLLWYGFWVTWGQLQRGVTDVQAVDMPKYLILMVIPFGFFMLSVQFFRQFLLTLKDIRKESSPRDTRNNQKSLPDRKSC